MVSFKDNRHNIRYLFISLILCVSHFLSASCIENQAFKAHRTTRRSAEPAKYNRQPSCDRNPENCQTPHKYLIYTKGFSTWMRRVDGNSTPSSPIKVQIRFIDYVSPGRLASVDYVPSTGKYYYADCLRFDEIDAVNFREKNFGHEERGQCFGYLNHDDDLLFYISYWANETTYRLYSRNLKNKDGNARLIYEFSGRPLSLVVYPKGGYLFLSTWTMEPENTGGRLLRVGYSGDLDISYLRDVDVRSMSVDATEDRLYWITHSNLIESVIVGDNNRTIVAHSPLNNTENIVVDDQWIYVKNQTHIRRMNKRNPKEFVEVVGPSLEYNVIWSDIKIIEKPENYRKEIRYLEQDGVRCEMLCYKNNDYGIPESINGVLNNDGKCTCPSEE